MCPIICTMPLIISIHALLAESDAAWNRFTQRRDFISIHALLAESDPPRGGSCYLDNIDFYPRPPCGERPWARGSRVTYVEISIHALLAESDFVFWMVLNLPLRISIHALLAESDCSVSRLPRRGRDFYPRSPCGERPSYSAYLGESESISIHALLAESDTFEYIQAGTGVLFLSTLSLRRATLGRGEVA